MDPSPEYLTLTANDYLRYLSAVAGRAVDDASEYPLTASFLPFAIPAWRMRGAEELPEDGASPDAIPGGHGAGFAIVALGQSIHIRAAIPTTAARLIRKGRTVEMSEKLGRGGPFRLITVEREISVGSQVHAVQVEKYALRTRSGGQ